MRLLVCGSRTYTRRARLYSILDALTHERDPIVLIHGAAKGADTLAADWATNPGNGQTVTVEAYPADWGRWGRAAGPVRNADMLDQGKPDLVVAFIDKPLRQSRGTADMVARARKAHVPVHVEDRA